MESYISELNYRKTVQDMIKRFYLLKVHIIKLDNFGLLLKIISSKST